jgi:zinc and cadmium transporter
MIWLYTLASVTAVSLVSLVGAAVLFWRTDRLRQILFLLVALAAGALFGDVLVHLLPEIFAELSPPAAALGILAGILIFFILEKFLNWTHQHQVDECPDPNHHAVTPLGHLSLISDGLHNFLDGLIIGVSFLVSPAIGLASTLAVILHEIPQEMGDFAILLHAGFSRRRALIFNLLSASLAIAGAVIALLLGQVVEPLTRFLLPPAAGGFLYLAGSDLVPELHKTTDLRRSLGQLAAMLLGIALMFLLLLWE